MRELLARLEELLGQTDAAHSEIREIVETLEARDDVLTSMEAFIESGYRDEFEDTLSFEEQATYRQVFELDTGDVFGSLPEYGEDDDSI